VGKVECWEICESCSCPGGVCVFVCPVQGDEWEEKWGEHYHDSGKVAKYADKWGKAGEQFGVLLVTSCINTISR